MLRSLFKPRPARLAGRALYARVVEQSRTPALYADLGAPDTVEGRFEIYSLHVVLLLERLRGHGEGAAEVSQALFDAYVKALDDALREMGVGDLSVGKKMRKLGEALYGRMTAYEKALEAGDRAALAQSLGRNVFEDETAPNAGTLADYAFASLTALGAQPFADVVRTPAWPEIAA